MPKRKVDSDEEASFDDDDYEDEEQPKAKKPKSKVKPTSSKRKQVSDDEEEHASSSEEEPVAKQKTIKKPRTRAPESSSSNVKKSAEGDKYIELGKKKRATVREFKGVTLIDIREFYGAEGDEKPGKKGISLSLEQWESLRDNAAIIDELCQELKK